MKIPEYIVDAHHHLWDLTEMRHTWLAEQGVVRFFGDPKPIQKNYHVPDFHGDIDNLPVTKSVHIQCGVAPEDSVKETQWVQAQSDAHGLANAIVGFCDLTADSAQDVLEAHQAYPNMRGIRQIVGRSAAEDAANGANTLLESSKFREGIQSLASRDLSFDLQLTPPLLKASARLFKSIEAVPLALCHAGSPNDLSSDGMAEWQAGLRDFAEHENMICKISGLGMFDQQWTIESFRERVLRTIDIFGPSRVAFGSNFPVDKLYASYVDTFKAFLPLTADFSNSEREDMFGGVAERFYRI